MTRSTRTRLDDDVPPEKSGGAYDIDELPPTEFIKSGFTPLDGCLGGGWPLRRISIISGDRSTNKCVYDGYILTEKGLLRTNDIESSFPMGDAPWEQTAALEAGKNIYISHSHKSVAEKTVKMITRRGFELETTPDHRIQVLDRTLNLVMRRMDKLVVGDQIFIASDMQLFPKKEVSLKDVIISKKANTQAITVPKTLTIELAMLLGCMVADGTVSKGVITACKTWKRVLLATLFKEALGVTDASRETSFSLNAQGRELFDHLLAEKGPQTARFKKVPNIVLAAPCNQQRAFLRGLLSCDGHLSKGNFIYVTASKRLSRDVQMMLLNFGIVASVKEQHTQLLGWDEPKACWYLYISGASLDTFLKRIGIHQYETPKKRSIKVTSDFDSIPYVIDVLCDEIAVARKKFKWKRNGEIMNGGRFPKTPIIGYKNSGVTHLSRARLNFVIDVLRDYINPMVTRRCEALLAKCGVFDPVVTLNDINEEKVVVDVHVPDTHLFWCSGFVSHNTGLVIEAMINFARQYPKGHIYYREPEAAFDRSYAGKLGLPVDRVDFLPDYLDPSSPELNTVEDLDRDLAVVIKRHMHKDDAVFYAVDSVDALSDNAEVERDIGDASYGGDKAKKLGQLFRKRIQGVKGCNMHMMLVFQIRDNVNAGMFGKKTKRSGGHAPDFYASHIVELQHTEQLKQSKGGVERVVGVEIRATVTKNKVTTPFQWCQFPLMFNFGIDEVRGCVEWLQSVKALSRYDIDIGEAKPSTTAVITAINRIQDDKQYRRAVGRLSKVTAAVWKEINEKFEPRRSKY